MYTFVLKEQFTASHCLPGVREDLHDHDWTVKVVLTARPDQIQPNGMYINHLELQAIVQAILPYDQNLNETYDFPPTAECFSKYFYEQLDGKIPGLKEVWVGEYDPFLVGYAPNVSE